MEDKKKVPRLRFPGFTDDWKQRKFGDIVMRETLSLESSDDYPFVEYEDVVAEEGRLNKDIRQKEGSKKGIVFDGSQVLYGKLRPYLHNWLNPDFSGVAVGDWWVLKPQNTDKNFVYRLIQTQLFDDVANQSAGSKMPRADWNLVSNTEFAIPTSHDEQEKIGEYFSNLDNLITLHQRQLDNLKNLKKGCLQKMFPRYGETKPELRFPGFTDDWEQRKLSEVVTEIKRTDEKSDAPVMMITAENGFINQSERYSTNNAGQSLKKYILLEKGELAYNHGASKLRPYGSCFALTTEEKARIPFVYHCFSTETENSEFLSIVLNGKAVEKQLRRIVSSGARMDGLLNISFDEYTSIPVMLPRKDEQDRIAEYFKNLDHLITLHQRKLDELNQVKKGMLQQMFV